MWSTLLCRGEGMRRNKMAGGDKNGAEARGSSLYLSSQRSNLCQFCGECRGGAATVLALHDSCLLEPGSRAWESLS